MVPDFDSILSRCASQSVKHLGRKSLHLFYSYLVGYELCCSSHSFPKQFDQLGDWSTFQDWIQRKVQMTDEHKSRLNAWACVSPFSYVTLISADDATALDTFINLRNQAMRELNKSDIKSSKIGDFQPFLEDTGYSKEDVWHSNSETAFHKLEDIQKRPKLYFGSDWSLSDLWAYFSGYQWCERDHGIEDSCTQQTLTGFQVWMEHRYPFGRDIPWSRILEFLFLASRTRALDSFIEHLEMYQNNLPADTPDPTMQEMLSNIVRQIEESRHS